LAPQLYTLLVFAVTFGVPLLLLLWTYSATACALWDAAAHAARLRVANDARASNSLKVSHKIITILYHFFFIICNRSWTIIFVSLPNVGF
jgi:hypothetical protein